ncbi:MAG: ADYC domain-containing protein [Alphaproteobacteria bacterium]
MLARRTLTSLLGLAVASVLAMPAAAAEPAQLHVEGTEFVLTMADGRILRSVDLVGATLRIAAAGGTTDVTIQNVQEDRKAVGGRVMLHHLIVTDQQGRTSDFCAPDADGRRLGFPVPDGEGGFDLTCTAGAIGKCIRWGYRPWDERVDGPPLGALHRACVHMVRADYGGDGQMTTRDGTLVDIYDRFGIQTSDRAVPMRFEAAWGVDGAICVAHPRIPEHISLAQLAERYPHLQTQLGAAVCTEDKSRRNPAALLFNRS